MSSYINGRGEQVLARLVLTILYFYFLIMGVRLLFFGVLWGRCDSFEGECEYTRMFGIVFGAIMLFLAFVLAVIGNTVGRDWRDRVTKFMYRWDFLWFALPILFPLLGYVFAEVTGIGVSATGEYVFEERKVGIEGVDGLPDHLSILDLTVRDSSYPTMWRVSPQGNPITNATVAMPEEHPAELSNCCEFLPREWKPLVRHLRWSIRDWRTCTTTSYQGDLPIEKYEKPGRIWIVFTKGGRVRILASAKPSAKEMLSWGVKGAEPDPSRCEGKWRGEDTPQEFTSDQSLIR